MKGTFDTSIKDIFTSINKDSKRLTTDISVPNDFYQELLDYFLERGYLNALPEREKFIDFRVMEKEHPDLFANDKKLKHEADFKNITWLKVERLPIHPSESKEYDLLSRWQSVLSTLHTWGHRFIFLLQRKRGETNIYLGAVSLSRSLSSKQALEQFKEAASSGMPGIDLRPVLSGSEKMDFVSNLEDNKTVGAVTGIPSFKKESNFGILQTLDQLAFGIRDINGNERDFSLMVVADPVNDETVSRTISKFRKLGSEIHLDVSRNLSTGENYTEGKSSSFGIGGVVSSIGSF
ncbi:MAG: hypothetical protein FWF08_08355, partial [Oscillospiraceae bacterium]|nr:hypothetical protein [Oscillospiraceae bacterium]